ncbi:MAG: glycosyltransferase family 2 protein [Clostridiales bacterium]|nr:glycosyltransferase family 2 protein [Clostridiales bacterium]
MKKLSIVIPMYNESMLIAETVAALVQYCSGLSCEWELIFSDDGSVDGCAEPIRQAAGRDARIKLIRSEVNLGKGAAVRRGILASLGDTVLFTDCDLAYGIEQMDALLWYHVNSGDDITLGSRSLHAAGYSGYSLTRRMMSRVYRRFLSLYTGCPLFDSQTGLKCFKGDTARKLFSVCKTDGFAFDLEVILLACALGFTLTEFPVKVLPLPSDAVRKSRVRIWRDAWHMLGDIHKMKKRVKEIGYKNDQRV